MASHEQRRFALVSISGAADAARSRFAVIRTPTTNKSASDEGASGGGGAPALAGYSGAAGDTLYIRHRIADPVEYYFARGDSVCRLCNEYVAPSQINFHLFGSGPRGPATHIGREIVLDSLIHAAKQGFDPAAVMRSWPYVLAKCENFVRLPQLWPADLSDLPERCRRLTSVLDSLKQLKVLELSISPHSESGAGASPVAMRLAVKRRVAFERLECIGDNAWGSNMAARMMRIFEDKGWHECRMFHSFNTMRDIAETNSNLEKLFDLLQLNTLLPPGLRDLVGEGKMKADVFESIIGELDMFLYGVESNMWGVVEYTEVNGENLEALCILIRHTLNEIYDLTLLTLLFGFAEHGIPLAAEIAQVNLSFHWRPALDIGPDIRTRRPVFREGFVPQFQLPPQPAVYDTPLSSTVGITPALDRYGPAVNGTSRRRVRPKYATLWSKLVVASEYNLSDAAARATEELGKSAVSADPASRATLERSMVPRQGNYDRGSTYRRTMTLHPESMTSTAVAARALGSTSGAVLAEAVALAGHIQPQVATAAPSAAALLARRAELQQAARARAGFTTAAAENVFAVLAPTMPFPTSPLMEEVLQTMPKVATGGGVRDARVEPPFFSDVEWDALLAAVDERWKARWASPLVEKLFTDDVEPTVVLAQFEASLSMRSMGGASASSVADALAEEAEGLSQDASIEDVTAAAVPVPDPAGGDDDGRLLEHPHLSRRHRFADGITIGSGETQTLLYMTAESAAVLTTSHRTAGGAGSFGAASGKPTSAADSTTGAIDLEEIKRRNQDAAKKLRRPR